jgi:capsular polysaccharide biosynthesis protein
LERNLEEADEVGLLDLLILVAENIKLLIAGSLLAGVIAAGLAYIAPKSYVSHASLTLPVPTVAPALEHVHAVLKDQTPLQAAELMTSPRVLDPLIQRLNLNEARSIELARNEVLSRFRVTTDLQGVLNLEVTGKTPEQAQALANAIIDSWLASTPPSPSQREELQKLLTYAESSLETSRRMIEKLSVEATTPAVDESGLEQTYVRATLMTAFELQARYLSETTEILRLLQGYSREVVKRPPSLPVQSESLPIGLIALLGAMAAALLLMLWIFLVHAWRSAARDPRVAPKLLRLRSALGLK